VSVKNTIDLLGVGNQKTALIRHGMFFNSKEALWPKINSGLQMKPQQVFRGGRGKFRCFV